jgi:hypothetical protein
LKIEKGRTGMKDKTTDEVRIKGDTVLVRRGGNEILPDAAHGWPEGYVKSFTGVPDDFSRPPQGEVEKRSSRG